MPKHPTGKPAGRFAKLRKRLRVEVLYSFSFDTAAAGHPDRPGGRLVPADLETLRRIRQEHRKELRAPKFRILKQRLRSRDEACWIIVDETGDLAGYCHLAFASTLNARINHRVEVGAHQAYFFDDYVFKEHRGKGLHALSIAERCRIAAGRGITEGLTTITRTNAASLASYGKFGLRRRWTLLHLPLLNRTLRIRHR